MQYITNLDKEKLGIYKGKLITEEVILTDDEHILLFHEEEYKQLKPYIISRLFEVDNSAIHTPLKGQKRCSTWHTCQITNSKKDKDLGLYL